VNMNTKATTKNYHDQIKEHWDEQGKVGWKKDEGIDPFFNQFYSEYKQQLGHEVLDVGCGNGRYMVPFVRDGFSVTGLDISQGMLNSAERALTEQNLKARYVIGNSVSLPFENQSFDFVMSIGTIHHNTMDDIKKSFSEIERVLKPKKYFLFMGRSVSDKEFEREVIEDYRDLGLGFTAIDKTGWKKGLVQHYFNGKELQQLGEQNGFEVIIEPHEQIRVTKKGQDEIQTSRIWIVYRKV